jgi:hypothetical protein
MDSHASPELSVSIIGGMSLRRLVYRVWQFWLALRLRPAARDLERARAILGPDLYALFIRMQPGEQVHSLHMLDKLLAQGEGHPDLLVAALLHDVGKIRYKLHLWERAWIVLARVIFGSRARQWGSINVNDFSSLPFWHLPLIVAEQHPAWGGEMVAEAGGTPLTVKLIRCHADKLDNERQSPEGRLLALLQFVDDNS